MQRSLQTLTLLLLAGCASTPQTRPPPPTTAARPRMAEPAKMNDAVRAHFKKEMNKHGDDMTVLMWSILFLDVDGAAKISETIEHMDWLERPKDGEKPEIEGVPELIYQIQEDLITRSAKLSELAASADREPEQLATAFGAVANACVRCHSYYLYTSGPRRGGTAEETTADQ